MTFLDADDDVSSENQTTGFVVGFSLVTVASFVALIQASRETIRRDFYQKHTIKFLFPWACIVMILENATLAAGAAGNETRQDWNYVVYAVEASLAPSLLLSEFDMTYLVHKTRSVQFCGIYEGHSRNKNPRRTLFLKLCMRILALAMLVLSILVNFNVGFDESNDLAGRTGWSTIVSEDWNEGSLHVLLSLLPMLILSMCSCYFSLALWRYGSENSMVVHSSLINPWCLPFCGTVALFGCQWFGPRLFPILSNVGIFVFVESILLLLPEVKKDFDEATELRRFLEAVAESTKSYPKPRPLPKPGPLPLNKILSTSTQGAEKRPECSDDDTLEDIKRPERSDDDTHDEEEKRPERSDDDTHDEEEKRPERSDDGTHDEEERRREGSDDDVETEKGVKTDDEELGVVQQ